MARCDENWELSKTWADAVFKRVRDSDQPEWVVLFPEVNIFTPVTSYVQTLQSDRYYLPRLTELLYPRFSGLYNAVTSLDLATDIKFTKLYDITIKYDSRVSLLGVFSGRNSVQVHLHVKERSLSHFPQKRPKMEKWLEKAWIEKEKLMHTIAFDSQPSSEEPTLMLDLPLTSIGSSVQSSCIK